MASQAAPNLFRFSRWNHLFGSLSGNVLKIEAGGLVVDDGVFQLGVLSEWKIERSFLWTTIYQVSGGNKTGRKILLPSSDYEAARGILDDLNSYSAHHDVWAKVNPVAKLWGDFCSGRQYTPWHVLDRFWPETKELVGLRNVWPALNRIRPIESVDDLFEVVGDFEKAGRIISEVNQRFVTKELQGRMSWFMASKPPPSQVQREVAVRDETNALIVAGAGTGKTSTILTKVRYLVEAKIAKPSDILVVTFNTEAAEEVRSRCLSSGIEGVDVFTFHALGLMILGQVEGQKPPLLNSLESDRGRDAVIDSLVASLNSGKEFADNFAKFVLLYPRPAPSACLSESKDVYIQDNKCSLKKSLKGEWVRSGEELRIADWLAIHGVDYTYEGSYPYSHYDNNKKAYRPDFTIRWTTLGSNPDDPFVDHIVYLEHQALNSAGRPPKGWTGYLDKVLWCRELHRKNGTVLVESFSAWFADGTWEKKLYDLLTTAGVELKRPKSWSKRMEELSAQLETKEAIIRDRAHVLGLLRRALDLSRTVLERPDFPRAETGSGFMGDVLSWLQKNLPPARVCEPDRHALFQAILKPLQDGYAEYKREKSGIDFEDMIALARESVNEGKYVGRWSHYIVDEFQDASLSRLELMLALRRGRWDSRLLCVGDDWQSIIRFAGGDIRVMTEFEKRVGRFWRADLPQTYRYPKTITEVSSAFVQKNPTQMRKTLTPAPKADSRIRVVYSTGLGDGRVADALFDELRRIESNQGAVSVFLLSRYNSGIPEAGEQKGIREKFSKLKIEWLTAHRSKGREADVVIIGDLKGGLMGFPCRRDDDPILTPFMPPSETFEVSEERRLFYVAMTRAKCELVLLVDAGEPSAFVQELRLNHSSSLEVIGGGSAAVACPSCNRGVMVGRDGTNGRFYGCSNSPACPHTEQACPRCRQGLLVPKNTVMFGCSENGCDYTTQKCPKCGEGWLQPKQNGQTKEMFWGCSMFRNEENPCRYTQSSKGGKPRADRW
jgi:DNA helicase IV